MPMRAPVFGRAKTKPWARPVAVPDRRLRGRPGARLRGWVKREEPLCRACLAKGLSVATEEVDHIVPLSRGGSNDRSNMQGLCEPCHKAKSLAERQGGRSR